MITAGTRLGAYEILSPLGAGGMGEVYRAKDMRLGRDVAIKVLPEEFFEDEERRLRFEREARTLATLNHPGIAAVYSFEEISGRHLLVMELVEGEDLGQRLVPGPLPLDESLSVAKQIAEALEAAHEKGIVHRDLKPANVKVSEDGKVKLLDFGLAKAFEGDRGSTTGSGAAVTQSPTLTARATAAGVILGTAAYMSPEQARGKTVDKRADIWAWGCVLYEMLTGKRAFEGETVSDTLAAVLRAEPDWSILAATTPPGIRGLLKRCLEKDVRLRVHDIADARLSLMDSPAAVGESGGKAIGPADSRSRMRRTAAAGLVGLVLGGALVAGWFERLSHRPAAVSVVRLSLDLPRGQALPVDGVPNLAVSRDGARVAYVAKNESGASSLYVRSIGSFEATPLAETDGAARPFFSPDGQWLGYTAGNRVRKVAVSGGPSLPVCDAQVSDYAGAAWADDGSIFLPSTTGGLLQASVAGGACPEIVKADPARGDIFEPEALPMVRALLFTSVRGFQASQGQIEALDLRTGKSQVIVPQGTNPHYVEPGFLVFGRSGAILAAPFDPDGLKLLGEPVPFVEKVMPDDDFGIEQFAVSRSGLLAYVPRTRAAVKRRVVMLDLKGEAATLAAEDSAYEDMSLSPDGRRLAMTVEGATWNIWIFDRDRGTLTRSTFDNDDRDPIWTPDGKRLVYTSLRNGLYGLYWRAADGSGTEEQLLTSRNWIYPTSWSPDGRYLAFGELDPTTGFDILILPMEGDRKPTPFERTPFREWFAEFSRDGRFLAYESNESGRSEIYVRPFPGPGGKWQISTDGGVRPEWSRDGRELFYLNGDRLMRVPVDTAHAFSAGLPERILSCGCYESGRYYEVGPDGRHFFFIRNAEAVSPITRINMVFGWRGELERRARGETAR